MKRKNFYITLVFGLPVLVLVLLSLYLEYQKAKGVRVVFPISAYDPRDLLSGHYLHYKVDYGVSCPNKKQDVFRGNVAYMCLKPHKHIVLGKKSDLKNCSLFIKGFCVSEEFKTPHDRFYVPEKQAKRAEKLFQQAQQKQVVLSVTKNGSVFVKDLLIDGRSIQQALP